MNALRAAQVGCPSGGASSKKNAGAYATPGVFSGGNATIHRLLSAIRIFEGKHPLTLAGRRAGKYRITEISTVPFHCILWW